MNPKNVSDRSRWSLALTVGAVVLVSLAALCGLVLFSLWAFFGLAARDLGTPAAISRMAQKSPLDVVTPSLTVIGGVGGAVALVVAYRKRRQEERQEIVTERNLQHDWFEQGFREATKLLGAATHVEKLAGVIAMLNLASDHPLRMGQCFDVLCGAIRLLPSRPADIASQELHAEYEANRRSDAALIQTALKGMMDLHAEEEARRGEGPIPIRLDLSGANLAGLSLPGVYLHSANLREASLVGSELHGATLSYADLSDADLSKVKLTGADLTSANLPRATLEWADLSNADLKHANLSDANLQTADLRGVKLVATNLLGANFTEALLKSVDFTEATIAEAMDELRRSVIDAGIEEKFLYTGRKVLIGMDRVLGVDLEPRHSGTSFVGAVLEYADFSGLDLTEVDFTNAMLGGANLSRTTGYRVKFVGSSLGGVDLTSAYLEKPDLTDARLLFSNLAEASFISAVFQGATIAECDLTELLCDAADLDGADMWNNRGDGWDLDVPSVKDADEEASHEDDELPEDQKPDDDDRTSNVGES